MPYSPIHAVHDDDLTEVLEALGLARAFERSELSCKFCGVVVDSSNLYSIFPDGGQIKVACDRAECVKALLSHTSLMPATR